MIRKGFLDRSLEWNFGKLSPLKHLSGIVLSEGMNIGSSLGQNLKKKFDVYPSAYANAWAAKMYKKAGGGWRKGK